MVLSPDALRVVAVTPDDRSAEAVAVLIAAVLRGGVRAVLLRAPQLPRTALVALAARARAETAEHGAALVLSHDVELALAVRADAVQLGHGCPDVDTVRAGPAGRLALGRSAHWPLQPQDLQADYLMLSPFRPTHRSHPRPLLTPDQIAQVLALPERPPTLALGGLTAADVGGLPDGLAGVAVVRALADAADPTAAARELVAAADSRWPR